MQFHVEWIQKMYWGSSVISMKCRERALTCCTASPGRHSWQLDVGAYLAAEGAGSQSVVLCFTTDVLKGYNLCSVRLLFQYPLYCLLFEWEVVMSNWNVIPPKPIPLSTDHCSDLSVLVFLSTALCTHEYRRALKSICSHTTNKQCIDVLPFAGTERQRHKLNFQVPNAKSKTGPLSTMCH